MKKIQCGSSRPWGRLFCCAISVLVAVASVLSNTDSVVHKSGTESITGLKSFSVSPTAPAPITANAVANKDYVDVAVGSITGSYVRTTGDTMTGVLNLLGDPVAPNQAAN